MPTFLPVLVILSAAALFILIILYRLYDSNVEKPKMLDDELKEALAGARPDVVTVEPVRKAAAALAYHDDKVIIVRNFGKTPTKIYPVRELMGIELFVDDRVVARVVRGGAQKLLDDLAPGATKVRMRLIFDDPARPDFDLVLWDPNDAMTARAEGPRAAMETARRWFYHVEAIVRRPSEAPKAVTAAPVAPVPTPKPGTPAPPPTTPPAASDDTKPAPKKDEGDVLNAPLIPYL